MDTLKKLLIALGLLGAAYGAGYYYAPDKIKTVEKIVEKVIHEKDTKVTKEYDPITGKVTKETTETKEKETNSKEKDKETEKSKTKKLYAVKAGIVQAVTKQEVPTYRVGAEVRLPLFDSWLGAEGDIDVKNPKLGAYLRVEF